MIYLPLYVGDMVVTANNITEINALKKLLSKEFDMKDLGAASQIKQPLLIAHELSYASRLERKTQCSQFPPSDLLENV